VIVRLPGLFCALALCGGFASQAFAQAYPGKPIRVIAGVSPGVVADIVMRAVGTELSKQMGQPWVVENHPGGNFVIGANACKRAAADGYTVCLVNSAAMSLNPHVLSNMPYDPEKDLKPVTNLFSQISGLIAGASLQAGSIAELQALAVARPGALNYATLGVGSNSDILRQWLSDRWNTQMIGVPYKGQGPITTGLVSGEVDVTWGGIGSVASQLKAGKVKVLAVNASRRLPRLPGVPTFSETGLGEYPGLVWWGLVVPPAVPDAVVQRLNAEAVRLFRDPRFLEYLEGQFLEPLVSSPEEFAAFMRGDRERVGQIVRKFNFPRQ
jgi:tripartite-type tricarboxylate transporter receptor subunit TctC